MSLHTCKIPGLIITVLDAIASLGSYPMLDATASLESLFYLVKWCDEISGVYNSEKEHFWEIAITNIFT